VRTRTVVPAVVAGLALASGIAVADRGTVGGPPTVPSVRQRPGVARAADVRIDRRPLSRAAYARRYGPPGIPPSFLTSTRPYPGTVRTVARFTDPDGGVPWAVRTFLRRRTTDAEPPSPRRPSPRHDACVQVGRAHDGVFGWIWPGSTTLRPLAAATDLLAICRTDRSGPGVSARGFALTDRDPYDERARITRVVAFGIVAPGVRRVEVSLAGWRRTVRVRDGVFLAFGPPPRGPYLGRLRASAVSSSEDRSAVRSSFTGRMEHVRRAGSVFDPTAGRGLAVFVGTTAGRPCVADPAPMTGGLVGLPEPITGVLSAFGDQGGGSCRLIPRLRPGARPRMIGEGGATVPSADPHARLVADQQQLVPGRFDTTIQVPPDVVAVEIRSPVDVRTVRPIAGRVIAVWDGALSGGGMFGDPMLQVVGLRRDGTRVTGTTFTQPIALAPDGP